MESFQQKVVALAVVEYLDLRSWAHWVEESRFLEPALLWLRVPAVAVPSQRC
jgi:hypothetical protein